MKPELPEINMPKIQPTEYDRKETHRIKMEMKQVKREHRAAQLPKQHNFANISKHHEFYGDTPKENFLKMSLTNHGRILLILYYIYVL